jgi:hypothetical protein
MRRNKMCHNRMRRYFESDATKSVKTESDATECDVNEKRCNRMATQQKASKQNATLLNSNDKLHFLSITVEVTFAKIRPTMLKKLYPKKNKIKKILSYK